MTDASPPDPIAPVDRGRCPQCGMSLPDGSAGGACPRCLLLGVDDGDVDVGESAGETLSKSKAGGAIGRQEWQPPSAEDLRTALPGYGIIRLVGCGGMGAVYLGRQISLDRLVAIKVLPADMDAGDLNFAERFKNEARAMAKLSHPGIVAVFDFGETADGMLYIVMEYIDGTDVAQMVARQGRLHSSHAMAITAHVCDALTYAHARGIIHRDIKPSNIMIGHDGVVKVADFGLAKISNASASTSITQSGVLMGTMHFIAPEALEIGTVVDQRADVYAVGVMLFQMLTGKFPKGLFEMPSLQVPGLDPRYDTIVAKALREDRALRYQSAAAMRHDLDSILTQPVERAEASQEKRSPVQAKVRSELHPPPRPQRVAGMPESSLAPSMPRKSLGADTIVIGLVAVSVAIAFLFLHFGQKGKPIGTTDTTEAPGSSPNGLLSGGKSAAASRTAPFVNSLGMEFVPVPIVGGGTHGKRVLFSVWETRVRDYEVFAKETGHQWRKPPFSQTETHPAVMISWDDARAFCEWLTRRERSSRMLMANESYRLPSDHEWSCAVGIGGMEDLSASLRTKDGRLPPFPWGSQWPPPQGAGNYPDSSAERIGASKAGRYLSEYDDSFPFTSPVGSFARNSFGLFDLGGNAWEWVEDWYDEQQGSRALRGASWNDPAAQGGLRSSDRHGDRPKNVGADGSYGFRCVLAES